MANYQIRNNKPANYQAEVFIQANNNWMVLGTFATLEEATAFIKTRVDTETFKERIYDPVGRLLTPSNQPVVDA